MTDIAIEKELSLMSILSSIGQVFYCLKPESGKKKDFVNMIHLRLLEVLIHSNASWSTHA